MQAQQRKQQKKQQKMLPPKIRNITGPTATIPGVEFELELSDELLVDDDDDFEAN